MSLKIKEIILRWEDDGSEANLTKEEYMKKYAPVTLVLHHHSAPPPPPDSKLKEKEQKS